MISCSAEQSFRWLRWLKSYLRGTMEQQRVSNIALIEREHANSAVNNDMDRTKDIFGNRLGRDSYLFNVFYELI